MSKEKKKDKPTEKAETDKPKEKAAQPDKPAKVDKSKRSPRLYYPFSVR